MNESILQTDVEDRYRRIALKRAIKSGKNIGKAIDRLTQESLTDDQLAKREKIIRSMKKSDSFDKYGDDAKSVMYATATKIVKNKSMTKEEVQSLIDDCLKLDEADLIAVIDALSESAAHPSSGSVASGLKVGYGETKYKSAATGATHVVKHDGKHYRSGMMRSETLSGLLHLIDKTVNNRTSAGNSRSRNESDAYMTPEMSAYVAGMDKILPDFRD